MEGIVLEIQQIFHVKKYDTYYEEGQAILKILEDMCNECNSQRDEGGVNAIQNS